MEYSSKQQWNTSAKALGAHFPWVGLVVTMIGLVLVYTGCLGSTEQQGSKVKQSTNTHQATIPTQLPESFALTPSITPSKSSSSNATKSPHVETFTGSGVKKTTTFTAPKSWKIIWSCDLSSHNNTSYDRIIHANTTQNALLANGLETTCSKNHMHGLVTMNQAGNIYLVILSEGAWSVQVQYF